MHLKVLEKLRKNNLNPQLVEEKKYKVQNGNLEN